MREAVLNEKACKSIGTEKHMPGAWLTPTPANEEPEHLPKGSHKIILDIPMVLSQFPQNSQHRITNIFTAAAGRPQTTEISGKIQLKLSEPRLLRTWAGKAASTQQEGKATGHPLTNGLQTQGRPS